MPKVRVYELARELKLESKELVTKLQSMGIEVSSHQSTLTDLQISEAKKKLSGGGTAPAPKKTIIRRRKKASEEPPKVEEEKSAAPKVVTRKKEPEAIAAKAPIEEPAPVAEKELSKPEASSVEEAPAPSPVKTHAKDAESEKKTIVSPKKTTFIGAKVVRRASPEDLKKQQEREEAAKERRASSQGRPPRDSRPPRSGGGGNWSPRPQAPSVSDAPAPMEVDRSIKGGEPRRRAKVKGTSEEEANRNRNQPQKVKRGAFNAKDILRDINSMTEEEEDSIVEKIQAKTIYTPKSNARKRDKRRKAEMKKTQITTPRATLRVVKMGHAIAVGELAKQLNIKAIDLIKKLMAQGEMVTINQAIDFDTASLIAEEYGFQVQSNLKSVEEIIASGTNFENENTEARPPIVTIMGHVDHGKTSILDAIREADVAAGEEGGITQHIGAYTVDRGGYRLAFLDTPGHEAFSSMRARGAQVTDIVIIVVAADDGVMPQTIEAISHAKSAGVPIIVAVNKMDKPNINLDRVYTELTEHGIQSEEWGGDIQFVKVSAMTKMGIEDLLDAVNLQSEMLELETRSSGPAAGAVVEAHLDKNLGAVATIMVQEGELKVGDVIVAGTEFGKVRAMHDHHGKKVKVAGPSTPVAVVGLSGTPSAGDVMNAVADEKTAREAANWRKERKQAAANDRSSASTLEQLLGKIQEDSIHKLPLIVKADTQGSVEAIVEAIKKLDTDKVQNNIIHKAVGGISESDLTLSEASGAVIIGFNVRAGRGLDDVAENKGVVIRYFGIIYDVVDAVKNLMVGQLPPILEEVVIGHAEVRQKISVPKIGTIAGTAVTDGKITRSSKLRLIRDDVVIFSGELGSLRRFKDDVKEVASGYECGIGIAGYGDIKLGDIIEAYVIEETAATLD